MQVLVTGASGFIGGHIVKSAQKQGWRVRGLRRDYIRTGHVALWDIEWITGDLLDYQSLVYAMDHCDIVFHAAGFYPRRGESQDTEKDLLKAETQIRNVIKAAIQTGVKRLVYTSSLTTIGHPPNGDSRLADERDWYISGSIKNSVYYESKLLMEEILLQEDHAGLEIVILNPTAVFGPGDVNVGIGGLLLMVAKGKAVASLPGTINVIDARDTAEAHIQAAARGRHGERYILGGHNLTVDQALGIAAGVSGKNPPSMKIPLAVVDLAAYVSDLFPKLPLPANHLKGVRHWQAFNTSKAQEELGLAPRPFEETVRDALAWFKENGKY